MLETENGMMTRQKYKERYLYIFKMTTKPEVVKEHIVIVTDAYSQIKLN